MRTQYPVILVIAMALAGLMFGLSGFNTAIGFEQHNEQLSDQFQQNANNSSVGADGSFKSDARDRGSGLVGFVLTGTGALMDVVGLVAFLPLELESMGFPRWFAFPIGLGVQSLVGLGFVQFAANRVYR